MYYKYGGTLFFATAQPGFAKTIDQKRIKVSYLRHKMSLAYGPGGRGGLQPPQILGNSDFLGSKRKFAQRHF